MKTNHSDLLKALSLGTRVQMIELLKSRGPMCVSDIAGELNITASAVSQHLKLLRQVGLVNSERKGFWIPYTINAKELENCRQVLNDICTCECCEPSEESDGDDLEDLEKYKLELQGQLKTIQSKIDTLKSK
jgi:DNA-binding transcriptional ArsR family regulator